MFQEIYVPWISNYNKNAYCNHPSSVYESVHMASVSLPNINVFLRLNSLHANTCQNNISNVQMEAIAYAINAFENNKNIDTHNRGFFLGDGTGVGKSRIIAGVLSELWMRNNINFRAIWISINKTLETDAIHELRIVENLNNACPPWINISQCIQDTNTNGVLFTTYSSLKIKETFENTLRWLQNSENTLLIFDEAHLAKKIHG